MAIRRLMYGILLAISLWIFIVYIDYSALQLLVSVVIIPLVIGIITFVSSRHVKVNLEVKDMYVVKNKNIPLYIKISNPSVIPFIGGIIQIEMKNSFNNEVIKKKIKFNLTSKEINKFALDIRSDYLGRIEINVKKFKLYDYLGIFSFKGKIGKSTMLYVLPCNGSINLDISDRNNEYIEEPLKYSESEPGDDCSQVFDVRQFREGDKIQKIHWKLSAKKDDLYVKEFSMPIDASAEIMIELSVLDKKDFISYVDTIIETAYALSVALLDKEMYHFFVWYNEASKELVRKEITDTNDIWNTLYEIYHTNIYKESMAYKIYDEEKNNRNSYLFYITADANAQILYSPHKVFLVDGITSNQDVVSVELGNVYESIEYLGEV